ncbi:MAG: NHLP bacteriocin system secretion protein [Myxococcota bacterium]
MTQRTIRKIARSEAVENLSAVEQLDQRMVVIRAHSWLLMAIAVAGLSLAILWGFLGRVQQYVIGEGLLVEAGRPVLVESSQFNQGLIERIVPVGELVDQGESILVIANPELDKAVATAETYLAVLQKQDTSMTAEENAVIAKQQTEVSAQVALAKETADQSRLLVKMYKREVADLEVLFEKRLIPNTELVQGRASLYSAMQQVTEQRSQLAQAESGLESLLSTIEESRLTREQQIAQAENTLDKLTVQRDQATNVVAPIAGRVIVHTVGVGSVVGPGTHLAVMLPHRGHAEGAKASTPEYSAVVYLPFGDGKQVREGMDALIALPYARPSRYGYVKGTVTDVAAYVSGSGVAVHLGSERLAAVIRDFVSAPLEVTLAVHADDSTLSGLAWTSKSGYPEQLPALSMCNVRVAVREDRPIDLVIPWIKDQVGIDPPLGAPSETP